MPDSQSQPGIEIFQADLAEPDHQHAVLLLLDHYARHPMGQSAPLGTEIKSRLVPALQEHPASRVFLALEAGRPIGLATSFVGFSTFKAQQLLNIHDLVVHESVRGRGVGGQLIDYCVQYAAEHGMCAVTLEVHEDNPARRLYDQKGFVGVSPQREEGMMLFGKRPLQSGKNDGS